MCQHPACAAETRIRSKDCDVTIAARMGSRDAFPIPFPSFIYGYSHEQLELLRPQCHVLLVDMNNSSELMAGRDLDSTAVKVDTFQDGCKAGPYC